jgi:hypothetical protein
VRVQYDHKLREMIFLSPTELGDLLAFDRLTADKQAAEGGLKFMHDPGLRSDAAGQVVKELRITRIPPQTNPQPGKKQSGGFWFNLTVKRDGVRISSLIRPVLCPVLCSPPMD